MSERNAHAGRRGCLQLCSITARAACDARARAPIPGRRARPLPPAAQLGPQPQRWSVDAAPHGPLPAALPHRRNHAGKVVYREFATPPATSSTLEALLLGLKDVLAVVSGSTNTTDNASVSLHAVGPKRGGRRCVHSRMSEGAQARTATRVAAWQQLSPGRRAVQQGPWKPKPALLRRLDAALALCTRITHPKRCAWDMQPRSAQVPAAGSF